MTTEISVSNRLGIALATDSAVTISGNGHVKVFDTADKLFELSPQYPVGVMINGNMDCIGVPWELLVKEFRATEGTRQRATVEEWGIDFLKYVEDHVLIDETAVGKYVDQIISVEIEETQLDVTGYIQFHIFDAARQNRKVKVSNIDELLNSYFERRLAQLLEIPVADSLQELTVEAVIDSYSPRIEELSKVRFKGRELTPSEMEKFKRIVANAFLRVLPSDFTTGIVVAGFGERQTFPAVYAVEVDGRVLGRMKFSNSVSSSIETSPDGGQVIYFAQTDVIQRLLGGADPKFVERTSEFIEIAVGKVADTIEEALRTRKLSKKATESRKILIREITAAIRVEYEKETTKSLREQFSREFDRMVAMMPKQELIELAEALVSITAVERKATVDEGTVGGPVDVAFITKHEGFVWIKRKHYFEATLNPRYFWRKYGKPPNGEQRS